MSRSGYRSPEKYSQSVLDYMQPNQWYPYTEILLMVAASIPSTKAKRIHDGLTKTNQTDLSQAINRGSMVIAKDVMRSPRFLIKSTKTQEVLNKLRGHEVEDLVVCLNPNWVPVKDRKPTQKKIQSVKAGREKRWWRDISAVTDEEVLKVNLSSTRTVKAAALTRLSLFPVQTITINGESVDVLPVKHSKTQAVGCLDVDVFELTGEYNIYLIWPKQTKDPFTYKDAREVLDDRWCIWSPHSYPTS